MEMADQRERPREGEISLRQWSEAVVIGLTGILIGGLWSWYALVVYVLVVLLVEVADTARLLVKMNRALAAAPVPVQELNGDAWFRQALLEDDRPVEESVPELERELDYRLKLKQRPEPEVRTVEPVKVPAGVRRRKGELAADESWSCKPSTIWTTELR